MSAALAAGDDKNVVLKRLRNLSCRLFEGKHCEARTMIPIPFRVAGNSRWRAPNPLLNPTRLPRRTLLWSPERSLIPHMHGVSLVLQAVIIEEFAVEHQRLIQRHSPRCSVGLRIVDGNLDLQIAVVGPPDPFGQLALF